MSLHSPSFYLTSSIFEDCVAFWKSHRFNSTFLERSIFPLVILNPHSCPADTLLLSSAAAAGKLLRKIQLSAHLCQPVHLPTQRILIAAIPFTALSGTSLPVTGAHRAFFSFFPCLFAWLYFDSQAHCLDLSEGITDLRVTEHASHRYLRILILSDPRR